MTHGENQGAMNVKVAKFSEFDTRGRLFVDCAECTRGGNGAETDKCAFGWRIKRGKNGGCYLGSLLPTLNPPKPKVNTI